MTSFKILRTSLDGLRWILILFSWGLVAVLLFNVWWPLALLWIVPGFMIMMNLVGYLMVPFYVVAQRELRKWLKDVEESEPEE